MWNSPPPPPPKKNTYVVPRIKNLSIYASKIKADYRILPFLRSLRSVTVGKGVPMDEKNKISPTYD
jgi:hypothetical protein